MTEVVSVKFKNRGKSYFFAPNGKTVKAGEQVIVETSKGLEIADCSRGNHMVEDEAVVQPLRAVVRIATADDLRVSEINKQREKEAFEICQKKIAEHGLDMKLVDVECNFEGNKTMFFFTSDGRVDFRELVKDLASIFRNRIELRQIGVRDEAKMLGGLGICGRPFCCSKFLDDFQPVSTKMAKVQSMSLNPSKISGSCGRLMCCLRYEQEAYEDLLKTVPKQGAFVETPEGYGIVTQVNLLRQLIKVRLDTASDDAVKLFPAVQVATVPGGRPKDGEAPPSVLKYVPEPAVEEPEPEYVLPILYASDLQPEPRRNEGEPARGRSHRSRRKPRNKPADNAQAEAEKNTEKVLPKPKNPRSRRPGASGKPQGGSRPGEPKPQKTELPVTAKDSADKKNGNSRRRRPRSKPKSKPTGDEAKQ